MSFISPIPDYSSAPTSDFVEAKIRAAAWWPDVAEQEDTARLVAEMAIRGSIQRFLKIVKWRPFVSPGEEETRHFNIIDEESRIQLGEGLLSLSSLTISGTTYTLNQNVFCEPSNAAEKGEPYSYLQLWPAYRNYFHSPSDYPMGGGRGYTLKPRSIAVTGEWGQYREWPADAFHAIVDRAAYFVLLTVNNPQDVAGISEDGFSAQYDLVGPIDPKKAADTWPAAAQFDTIAQSYAKKAPGPQAFKTGAHSHNASRSYLPTV